MVYFAGTESDLHNPDFMEGAMGLAHHVIT
jgi:hypothetical protein